MVLVKIAHDTIEMQCLQIACLSPAHKYKFGTEFSSAVRQRSIVQARRMASHIAKAFIVILALLLLNSCFAQVNQEFVPSIVEKKLHFSNYKLIADE